MISFVLSLLLIVPAFLVPSNATTNDPAPMATFTKNLTTVAEPLYMGTNPTWPYNASYSADNMKTELTFSNASDIGTVTYQWYRAVGDETDPSFAGTFEPYSKVDYYDTDGKDGIEEYPTYGEAKQVGATLTYIIPAFYRDLSEPGIYTYYVVFTNTKGDSVTSFESNHRVTTVAPQVLFMTSQTYTSDDQYYFEGAPAQELSVTLGHPKDTPEYAEESYREIKYQWYKSTVAVSDYFYDDFPYFNETDTRAILGASGTISYADAADADGATITYTPVNDEVGGPYHYWPLVYTDVNDVFVCTDNIVDAVITVLPSPVTSVNRAPSEATVDIDVVLPPDRTVQPDFKYLIVQQGTDPGEDPTYSSGILSDNKATLVFDKLNVDAYDLYLVFKDDQNKDWPYKTAIPKYTFSFSVDSNAIDAGTTDGQIVGKGLISETNAGTVMTITADSFTQMAKHILEKDGGVRINTRKATIVFDNPATQYINSIAASRDVVIKTALVDKTTLSSENRQIIGDHPVYNFTVTAGATQVSSLNGGTARISIPYVLASDEKEESVVVYYIDESGKLVAVRGAYNAKTQTVDFTVSHFSTYAVAYNPVTFDDVSKGSWYYKAISFIAARNITSGVDNSHFAPDAVIKRGDLVVMLLRAYGISPDEKATDNFADAGNNYYTGYLAAAKRLGITKGVGDNLFLPEQSITRQDMITLIYRALSVLGELPNATGTVDFSAYTDGGTVPDYAKDAFKSLIAAGAIQGSDHQLRPADLATRAEMAQLLFSVLSA